MGGLIPVVQKIDNFNFESILGDPGAVSRGETKLNWAKVAGMTKV